MVYDDVLKITWLRGGFEGNWNAANTWANNLVYGGYDDWRLPTALNQDGSGPCAFSICNSSEMGYMFYQNWGKTAGWGSIYGNAPPPNTENWALYQTVQYYHWSGTVSLAPDPDIGTRGYAWMFSFRDGFQFGENMTDVMYAVAVRDGDVADVPVPATIALLGLGLAGIGAARRKQA
jgi:hypothetical protein